MKLNILGAVDNIFLQALYFIRKNLKPSAKFKGASGGSSIFKFFKFNFKSSKYPLSDLF